HVDGVTLGLASQLRLAFSMFFFHIPPLHHTRGEFSNGLLEESFCVRFRSPPLGVEDHAGAGGGVCQRKRPMGYSGPPAPRGAPRFC
ncbi:hypothetical protein, partial [Ralstonia pseudosolanacearum]|uniref:hypothetical protein n=1 Tax=Ralstonia pseudosolanacearum TaxID=1310165 RepID=UPI003CF44A3F